MTGNPTKEPGYAGDLNDKCVSIAQVLKPAGYSTYATGKWHVSNNVKDNGPKHNWPLQRGFDKYFGIIPWGSKLL
jgi:arylsulfatase